MTADWEYCRSNMDKLPPPVQIQLPEKLERFSAFFIPFFQSALDFKHFEKKDEPHFPRVPEIIHSQTRVYLHTKKVLSLKSLC